ncbi:hypothetical protein [Pseudomarimonas arenosa]|uniref:Lipoprotein n=1 Tax=Pseudomarimonas arenosa TaxID=2774145 RepID=A0AAW3ZKU2_9GAMM|nr:hypothetical protein [Pseudomarimonas arenosa]MBD8526055.1 hypothetical protein [Pseudomarimonas arenosa]
MPIRRILLCLVLFAGLLGCSDPEAERREAEARAQAAQARIEALADEAYRQFEAVQSTNKPELALAYAEDILSRYPNSRAAQRLSEQLPKLREVAKASAEQRRLESLWTYHAVDDQEAGGRVFTAYVRAKNNSNLRLVLRRHPAWGQSVYLLADSDEFSCVKECRVAARADDQDLPKVLISEVKNNVPPAVFLEEDQKMLEIIDQAQTFEISPGLKKQGDKRFLFEVSALDLEQLGPPVKGQND